MQSGREYHDIFPLWDWQKIPGATIEQKPDLTGDICRKGTRPFAGGVSDGMYGAAAFDFERDGLTARKSWFFFDSEFVCLGSGIGCSSGNPVVTTVNQCFLKGDVSIPVNGQLRTLDHGSHKLDRVRFVYHDGIAYIFPGNQSVWLENDTRTGSWLDISTQYTPKDVVTDSVFTLTIDHGIKPDNATYAYIVAPGLSVGSAARYAQSPPVEILSNTPALQAVRHRDLSITGAAFYQPGRLAFGKTVVEVDKPCLLLLRESGNLTTVTASNPMNTETTVLVSMSLAGKKPEQIRFDLPGGMKGGKSVTKMIGAEK
jgi:chondroitin AC lyase